ncbi:hypothetical protein NHP21005_06130 [Helicobacter sp. NHP21005]|uniref:hypothetical protein n=1 Tax=Helicobacter felistomachi TaxID=3040201 RepID=UPI002574037E|nr:hypothetical protein [Helicobacter sp. NHP21005]BEG56925.1 hypothetical protein NHP21005_06130 [Helicobacter sp. NHP21005]
MKKYLKRKFVDEEGILSSLLQGKDLQELYTLETGSRKIGARKILIKHFGTEKTGGLNSAEL